MRKDIKVKHILHIRQLENPEEMEEAALQENSQKAVDNIKEMIVQREQKVFEFKHANKRGW